MFLACPVQVDALSLKTLYVYMSALAQTISTLKKIFAPALLNCHVSHHAGMSRLGPQPGQWNGQPLAQPRGQPPFGGTNQGPEVLFFVDTKTACIKGCFPFLQKYGDGICISNEGRVFASPAGMGFIVTIYSWSFKKWVDDFSPTCPDQAGFGVVVICPE